MRRMRYPYDVFGEGEDGELVPYPPREDVLIPEDVEHGSMRAVRLGCTCTRCMERKRRANRHGHRWY